MQYACNDDIVYPLVQNRNVKRAAGPTDLTTCQRIHVGSTGLAGLVAAYKKYDIPALAYLEDGQIFKPGIGARSGPFTVSQRCLVVYTACATCIRITSGR